jgi:hypothetical protein
VVGGEADFQFSGAEDNTFAAYKFSNPWLARCGAWLRDEQHPLLCDRRLTYAWRTDYLASPRTTF